MKLTKTKFSGEITINQSKTHIHRLLFAAILTQSTTKYKIDNQSLESDDIKATLNLLTAINVQITYDKISGILTIDSQRLSYKNELIDCFDCATTLRIAIPILVYLFKDIKITGSNSLLKRPLTFYQNIFLQYNLKFLRKKTEKEKEYLEISGDIKKIFEKDLIIHKCESSQYISGLMYILPLINPKVKIKFTEEMESVTYLEITKNILNNYHINYTFSYEQEKLKEIKLENKKIFQFYKKPINILTAELDYSSLAFWIVANELGNNIKFNNQILTKKEKYLHPDQELLDILKTQKIANNQSKINLANNPDLLPILLVWACFQKQEIIFINYQRNALKESNRITNMIEQLQNIGANIKDLTEDKGELVIKPIKEFVGGEINAFNDHRIAMSFAIASTRLANNAQLNIRGSSCVKKSYPNFWADFQKLKN